MCGIVGAIANRDVSPVLLEGLRRLEYRGYDSAGMAVLTNGSIDRIRRTGKVCELSAALDQSDLIGKLIFLYEWIGWYLPRNGNLANLV